MSFRFVEVGVCKFRIRHTFCPLKDADGWWYCVVCGTKYGAFSKDGDDL